MNCPTPDFTVNSQTDFRPTTKSTFVLFRPLAWLTSHKSVCVLSVLLGLVALGALNRDLLADAYLTAASNPHEETAKIFPADTTLMYVSVTDLGALLREDKKLDKIIEAEVGDLTDLKKGAQETLDEAMEEFLGRKIRSEEDLEALGMLHGSIGVGFFHRHNMDFLGAVALKSSKAETLAAQLLAAKKSYYEELAKEAEERDKDRYKGEDGKENPDARQITVTEETVEHNGCTIKVIHLREDGSKYSRNQLFPVCVLGDTVVFIPRPFSSKNGEEWSMLIAMIDAYKGTKKSLYATDAFKKCMGKLSNKRLVSCYCNKEAFFDVAVEEANKREKDLMRYLGERAGDMYGEVLAVDGAIIVNGYADLPEKSTVARVLSGKRLRGERFVAADGLMLYAEVSCDMAESWKTFKGVLEPVHEHDRKDYDQIVEELAKTGIDFEKELGEAVESRAFFAMYDFPIEISDKFDYLAGLKVKDAKKARQIRDDFFKKASKKPVEEFMTVSKIGEYEVIEYKIDKRNTLAWMFVDDCLLLSGDKARLQKALDAYTKKVPALDLPTDGQVDVWIGSQPLLTKLIDNAVVNYERRVQYTERAIADLEKYEKSEHEKDFGSDLEIMKKDKERLEQELAMTKGFKKALKAFNPAFATITTDKDRLIARAQISFGKTKTTGKTTEQMADIAQTCASVGIALLVLVAGACCFIPRRRAA